MIKHHDEWEKFAEALYLRLERGERQYGDGSFSRPPSELAGELEEEALDIAGWGFVLWARIRKLRKRLLP